jgi:hypothetical protein
VKRVWPHHWCRTLTVARDHGEKEPQINVRIPMAAAGGPVIWRIQFSTMNGLPGNGTTHSLLSASEASFGPLKLMVLNVNTVLEKLIDPPWRKRDEIDFAASDFDAAYAASLLAP